MRKEKKNIEEIYTNDLFVFLSYYLLNTPFEMKYRS